MAQRGVNKVILVGNLGQDPDSKTTQSGTTITNVSVATSEVWNDKQSGQKQELTEWHKVVFFGRLAEIAAQYLKQGAKIYVEGRLQTKKWQDNNGQDRYTTRVIGEQMQMLNGFDNPGGGNQQKAPAPPPSSEQPGYDNAFDDDIPF